MDEQRDVIAGLGDAGVLEGIRWAYLSATDRVLADYAEAAGYDSTWLGMTRFTLFRDRLDRVFSCGRYAVRAGGDATVSLDVLHAELTDRDVSTMPRLATDAVRRADLDGSPGWTWQHLRWLLASCDFGRIGELPWPRKSQTKQRVARQGDPAAPQLSLFGGPPGGLDAAVDGLGVLFGADLWPEQTTLIVAHSQTVDHDGAELVIGRARLNAGGGQAWYWREDLLATAASGERRWPAGPSAAAGPAPAPAPVPDVDVRLRGALAPRSARAAGSPRG